MFSSLFYTIPIIDDAAFWNSMDFSYACTYIYTCTCIYTSNLTMCNEYEHRNLDNRVLCCTRTVYVVQSWLDSCTHCQPMPILADLVQNFVCSMHVHTCTCTMHLRLP